MRHSLRALLILITLFILNPAPTPATVIDKIKAVVNNEVITQSEIDKLLYPIYMRYKDIYSGEELDEKLESVGGEILEQLINDRLMLSEAKKEAIEVDESEITAKVEELRSRFEDENVLIKTLHEQNLTIKDLRDRYRDQLMIEKIVDMRVRREIRILPQEAESYYREHLDLFREPERAKVSSILIRHKEERTSDQTLALAIDILHRLQAGEDFDTLARNYSEGMNADRGGDLGLVKKGQYVDEIDKVIFSLDIGKFSDLVKTSLGYHIFKVYDRRKERVVPLAEARNHIIEALFRQKAEEKFKEWVKELRKDAFISIK